MIEARNVGYQGLINAGVTSIESFLDCERAKAERAAGEFLITYPELILLAVKEEIDDLRDMLEGEENE